MLNKSLLALCAASMLVPCEAQSQTEVAVVPAKYARSVDGEVQVFAANAGDDRRRVVQALVKAIADDQEASRFRVTWSTGEGEEKKRWGSDSKGNVVYDRQRKTLKLWSRDRGIMSQFEGHYSGVTDEVLTNLASALEKAIIDPDDPPNASFYLNGLVEHGAQQTSFEMLANSGGVGAVAEKYRKSSDGVVQAFAVDAIFQKYRVVITLSEALTANPGSPMFRVAWGYGAAGTSTDGALLYDREKKTIKYWLRDIGLYGISQSRVLYTNVTADMIHKVAVALKKDPNEKLPRMSDFQLGQLTTLGAKRTEVSFTDDPWLKR